ncbi:thermonuclease family protein [Arabiibacter massiliensis]|uniref:thermonuclease family protein n=1 Tax=Arabiibacter massiliensis TaxID=1870985 RepID=UPI0009BBF980|nr:thermonuclease family protein [Arabiibacter massiliensis]
MADKLSSLLRDKNVQRALGDAVKASGNGPTGKVLGLLLALVLAGVVWVGSQLPALTPPAEDGSPAASADGGGAGAAVSDAARQAAERDAARGSSTQRGHLDPATFDQVTVRHVVDGDTLAVEMPDGSHESVRFVGLDTPESVAPEEERNCEEGVQASDHMKSLVGKGDTLWLQYDTSVTDKYGRPLAYVWNQLPASAQEADDPAFIAQHMLNAIQVIDGYGQARTYRPDTYHDGLFAQWGAEALADARGVTHKWA